MNSENYIKEKKDYITLTQDEADKIPCTRLFALTSNRGLYPVMDYYKIIDEVVCIIGTIPSAIYGNYTEVKRKFPLHRIIFMRKKNKINRE